MSRLSFALASVICASNGLAAPKVPLEIDIKIDNRAHVPTHILKEAKFRAKRLFAQAGIGVNWFACEPVCRDGAAGESFLVAILNEPGREPVTSDALGFVVQSASGWNQLGVVYPRIRDMQIRHFGTEFCGYLLGYVIAHELTHLILFQRGHDEGIMQASWNNGQLDDMVVGRLRFTSEQSRRLLGAVRSLRAPSSSQHE